MDKLEKSLRCECYHCSNTECCWKTTREDADKYNVVDLKGSSLCYEYETIYDYFMGLSLEQLVKDLEYLASYGELPWDRWANKEFCENCAPITVEKEGGRLEQYTPCECYDENKDGTPPCPICGISHHDLIKMWLKSTKKVGEVI